MTRDVEDQIIRNGQIISSEGGGIVRAATPEDLAQAHRLALAEGKSTKKQNPLAELMAAQVMNEGEEVIPEGMTVVRHY